MCHGVAPNRQPPLTIERYQTYFGMAADMGFTSISYDALAAWRDDDTPLPGRPIMFDIDHPVKSVYDEMFPVMRDLGFSANLFVNTLPMETEPEQCMTWDEIGELAAAGWQIGAHTHTHPNLSQLGVDDPSGAMIRSELETCDTILQRELGITPRDFAYTTTTWSSAAEAEVKKRYRFARLWIIGSTYQADGGEIRYADLVGVAGNDESDGGPPHAARYITRETPAYQLPSMELGYLIYQYDAFRTYLEGALQGPNDQT